MDTPTSFDCARLAALKEYARLEFELCLLLRNLLQVDDAKASAIFYAITNTRARYAIIASLIDLGTTPKWKAWAKIEKWLGPCDSVRNHLVHWFEDEYTLITMETDDDGKPVRVAEAARIPRLKNPSRRHRFSSGEKYYRESEIYEERDKIRVMMHIVNRFEVSIGHPDEWPWSDIFQQPVSDQTPVEFLQRLNLQGHEARLPPYDR